VKQLIFETWWDTIYYTLLQKRRIQKKIDAKPMTTLIEIGRLIKKARIRYINGLEIYTIKIFFQLFC
jgi:hypothetical protein